MFEAHPDQQKDMRWVSVTLTIVATVLLIFRLTATIKNRGWLGYEDAFVAAANAFLIIFGAMLYRSTTYGFGLQVAEIHRTGGNLTKAMKFFWLTQPFYTLTNGFNKMAFIALYYRIFPLKLFRQMCTIMMALSICWTVSYLFVCLFQCTPVQRTYDRTIPGTCINFFWHRWTNAILNILIDIMIFILPVPVIIGLNMSVGSRVGLVVLFSLGFFICLTTALRMSTLPLTLRTKQPSYESAPTNLWSFIEAATGVICACLISLRQSVSTLWPKRWSSRKSTSSGQYRYRGSDGPSGNGLGGSQSQGGRGRSNSGGYHMDDVKSTRKGMRETYASMSPSESQEQIVGGTTTKVHVETDFSGRKSPNGSEDTTLQGITVTTDVEVVRG